MQENSNHKKSNKITATEDKIRLTLKQFKEYDNSPTKLWTYIGLFLTTFTTILTTNFKQVLGITPELFKSLFIILSAIFFILCLKEIFKIIKNKMKGTGDEDWFILKIQNKEISKKDKPQKTKFSLRFLIGKCLQYFVYLLPLILWLIVIFLIGWNVAFSKTIPNNGDMPYWSITIFFSIIYFVLFYPLLIIFKDSINEWFNNTFYT